MNRRKFLSAAASAAALSAPYLPAAAEAAPPPDDPYHPEAVLAAFSSGGQAATVCGGLRGRLLYELHGRGDIPPPVGLRWAGAELVSTDRGNVFVTRDSRHAALSVGRVGGRAGILLWFRWVRSLYRTPCGETLAFCLGDELPGSHATCASEFLSAADRWMSVRGPFAKGYLTGGPCFTQIQP